MYWAKPGAVNRILPREDCSISPLSINDCLAMLIAVDVVPSAAATSRRLTSPSPSEAIAVMNFASAGEACFHRDRNNMFRATMNCSRAAGKCWAVNAPPGPG